ncbi:MAG: hypothetical protein AW07_02251 [Candidatus Accumulibacter sp. SK-11]|nr:MAG: hypothetical protein AW07_02251 [Candidatus Accumulibacter sp. SK-11]
MAAADLGARRLARHQRTGDADVLLATEQAIRIVKVKGQAEDGTYRPEGDVALVPGHPHAEDFLALPHPLADDPDIGNRPGVGSRPWAGQRESGNLLSLRQTGQIVVLLRFGAVVQQQLGGAERVRDHHRHRQRRTARRQLGDDLRVRVGRELETTVAFRNDHAQETLVLDVLPSLRRQIAEFAGDLPVIDQRAGPLDFVVHE